MKARMPKAGEPDREKTQRDYMMEEMQWLASDFKAEAKWKRANAKKIARAVEKYHQVIVRAEENSGRRGGGKEWKGWSAKKNECQIIMGGGVLTVERGC